MYYIIIDAVEIRYNKLLKPHTAQSNEIIEKRDGISTIPTTILLNNGCVCNLYAIHA